MTRLSDTRPTDEQLLKVLKDEGVYWDPTGTCAECIGNTETLANVACAYHPLLGNICDRLTRLMSKGSAIKRACFRRISADKRLL